MDAWLPLDADRAWTLTAPPLAVRQIALRIEIREAGAAIVQTSHRIDLSANNLPTACHEQTH